jgi:hypothetical protein
VNRSVLVFLVAVLAVVIVVAISATELSSPGPLPVTGGIVGRAFFPQASTTLVTGYVNVTARLFNVSVSSMSFGPYALNQVPGGNRIVAYAVSCFEISSCSIAFSVVNDSTINNYVQSLHSVLVDIRLSNGEVVRGNATVLDHPTPAPTPTSGSWILGELTRITSDGVVKSNLSAYVPLNDSVSSPVVQVTIGSQTVNSSFFVRPTVPITLPNGTKTLVQGQLLLLHGPIVYYVMQNAGHMLPITISLRSGERVSLSLLASSLVYTYLQQ